LQANDGTSTQQESIFWWDGRHIGWVRTQVQADVGAFTGMYIGNPPLNNFGVIHIQAMIDSGWVGGPVPSGYSEPSAVDSSVT
jgi:hypothetical protein